MPLSVSGLPTLSPAGADLGLGAMLQQQVAGETEEERKKRMREMQEQKMMGAAGSPATLALFGGGLRGSGTAGVY